MTRKSFSLIELMVAVSVLSIGIVMIARSFLSASNALTNGENRILALNFLEGKMGEIEEEAIKGSDKAMNAQADVLIGPRTFTYRADSDKVNISEKEKEKYYLDRVILVAGWNEGSKSYDEILGTYFNPKKKE